MKFPKASSVFGAIAVVGSVFFATQALGQSPVLDSGTIAQGETGDVALSWNDGDSGAGGVQVTGINFTPDGDVEDFSIVVTDVFSGEEVLCTPTATTIAPNVAVTCNETFTTVALEQTAAGELGDVESYARLRFQIAAGSTDQDIAVTADWQSFDPRGLDLDGGDIQATVTVEGAPPAVLAVDPSVINFGGVRIGETSDESPIQICNDAAAGAEELNVTDITVTGPGFAEGEGGSCAATPFALAPGACCNYHVTFSPDAEEGFTGAVAIESSVGTEDVALEGQGTVSDANLAIDPTARDFGELDLNDPASTQAFTIRNAGEEDAVTGISVPDLAAPFSITSNNCDDTLAPQADCQIAVSFDPTEAGTFDATLAVNSDANNVSASLNGEGTAEADISIDPDFGPVNLGRGAPGETLTEDGTVTNSGSAAAEVSCSLGEETNVFSTTPSPLTATVDANSSVDFSLACALPEDGEEGDRFTATLTCSVDGEEVGTHELSCAVTEIEPLPVPTMGTWSIALFAMLMLLVGGISLRFFRT